MRSLSNANYWLILLIYNTLNKLRIKLHPVYTDYISDCHSWVLDGSTQAAA